MQVTAAEHKDIFIGATRVDASTFTMYDGTWTFSDWFNTQPDNTNGNENCVTSNDINGYSWNDTDCSTLGFVVCQLDPTIEYTCMFYVTYITSFFTEVFSTAITTTVPTTTTVVTSKKFKHRC